MAAAMRNQGIYAALLACLALSGCPGFTSHDKVSEPSPAEAKKASTPTAPAQGADPHAGLNIGNLGKAPPAAPAEPVAPPELATASHILIRYAGAVRTGPEVTRTKEEARKLAEQIDKKAKAKNADFATLANDYTEDPSGKGQGGKLGTFPKGRMVPEFDKPVFSMAPGEVSDVIETGFGFHVIKREK
jgi:parvulin-like peptidyl-prolyl isomerase